ncbi:MAG: glycosyltransferase, partial [Acidimicrobiia bacterium]
MRVLVCSQGFPRHPDDHHAPFILDHARALAAAGVEVTVLCPSAPELSGRDRFGEVDVVRFRYAPRRLELLGYSGAMHRHVRGPHALLLPLFMLGYFFAAIRLAASADVVHGHWWAPSGLVAVVAARLRGVASVVHVHGTDATLGSRHGLRSLARWVLRRADVVMAASSALGEWVRSLAGPRAEVVVAPMPLDPARVPSPSPPPPDGPVVAVGRLVPEKGFDVLIRAVGSTGDRLVLVGEGAERGALEALASSLGANVDFAGVVPPAELADWYRRARVVAVPSRREGFGLVAAEALAAGRPVVASDVGGLTDIVSPGVSGLLVPPGDPTELAAALGAVEASMGSAGPESVHWLSPPAIAELNVAAYDSAIARRVGRRPLLPVLVKVVSAAFVLVSGIFFYLALRGQWDEASALRLRWEARSVLAATVSVAVAHLILSASWVWLLRRMGGVVSWPSG